MEHIERCLKIQGELAREYNKRKKMYKLEKNRAEKKRFLEAKVKFKLNLDKN